MKMADSEYFAGCKNIQNKSQSIKTEQLKIGEYTRNIYGYEYDTKCSKDEYTVLLTGTSQSGKSTLIDCFANFFMGRKSIKINKRFYATINDTDKEDTTDKEAFCFYTFCTKDTVFNFIDSPSITNDSGFVDTKHERYFQKFIKEMKNSDIQVNAVGLVIQNHFNIPLPPAEENMLRFVTDLLGRDQISSHIIPFITYADANTPPVLDALKESGIDTDKHLAFNNVCLNTSIDQITEMEKICWRRGLDNVKNGIEFIKSLEPIYLLDITSTEPPRDNKREQLAVFKVLRLTLNKGNNGFGFSITGGIGQEQYISGDDGIFIGSINEGGVTDKDGQLRVGDKIIGIEDKNLVENVNWEKITVKEAERYLEFSSECPTLLIGRMKKESSNITEDSSQPMNSDTVYSIPTPPRELPSGWSEITDGNGTSYYHHTESGRTQWEYPTPELNNQRDIATGWEEFTDDNGELYYHHRESGLTQWKYPMSEVPPEVDRDPMDHRYHNSDEYIQKHTVKHEQNDVNNNGLDIRIFEFKEEYEDCKQLIRRVSFGNRNYKHPTKTILLIGATGAGKTSLVNSLVNKAFGIKFEDVYRLKIIDNESQGKTSEQSQTEWITVYEFNHINGMRIDYNLTIIDTPGLNDTRGLEKDKEMFKHLEMVLRNKEAGVDELHCIGIVTQASATRLTAGQKYVYDGCMKMFGNNVERIIHIMATYSDQSSSNLIDTLEEAGVKHQKIHHFNNSSVYLANAKGNSKDIQMNAIVWKMYMSGACGAFLKLLKSSTGQSLNLTIETLENRQLLYTKKERNESDFLNYLHKAALALDGTKKMPCPEKAFNCTKCKVTCHKPCQGIKTSEKCHKCLEEGDNCAECGCSNTYHKSGDFQYVNEHMDQRNKQMEKLIKSFHELRNCIENLQDIALRPHEMSMEEYLDILMEEKDQKNSKSNVAKFEILNAIKEEEKRKNTLLIDKEKMENLIETVEKNIKKKKGLKNKWKFMK